MDSVNDTPSNDEDEPEMFKRSPWRRRRGRRRRRRFRIRRGIRRIRVRRIIRKVCKFGRFIPHIGKYIVYKVSNKRCYSCASFNKENRHSELEL